MIRLLSASMLLVALAFVTAFGVVGVARFGGFDYSQWDFQYVYAAGVLWIDGLSPYNYQELIARMQALFAFEPAIFAYPPQLSLFSSVMALLPPLGAKAAMIAINLILLAFLAAGVLRLLPRETVRHTLLADPWRAVLAAAVIGNPFAAHVVWMGQTSILGATFAVWSWIALHSGRPILAGLLLGVSTIKPQIAFLLVFWLLIDRQWRALAACTVAVLLLASVAMWVDGPVGVWFAWLKSMADYSSVGFNSLDNYHVFGVRPTLMAYGLTVPTLVPVALLCMVFLYRYRHQIGWQAMIGLLLATNAALVYAHDYDLVACSVLFAPLVLLMRRHQFGMLLIGVLSAVLFFPTRIWVALDHEALSRLREPALLALVAIILLGARQQAAAADTVSPAR